MNINLLENVNQFQSKIKNLYSCIFGKKLNDNIFKKKLTNDKFGCPKFIVSEDNGEFVGMLNLLPRVFKNTKYYLMTSVGVKKDYRKTESYYEMVKLSKLISIKYEIPIIAFPNKNTFLPLTKIMGFSPNGLYRIVIHTGLNGIIIRHHDIGLVKDKIKYGDYKKYVYDNKCIVHKDFYNYSDVLEILPKKYDSEIDISIEKPKSNILVLAENLLRNNDLILEMELNQVIYNTHNFPYKSMTIWDNT